MGLGPQSLQLRIVLPGLAVGFAVPNPKPKASSLNPTHPDKIPEVESYVLVNCDDGGQRFRLSFVVPCV